MSTRSSGHYTIDSDYYIIAYNDSAKEIYPSLNIGEKCHMALMGLDSPCPICPVMNQVYGPKTYRDPIRNIYETVDAVETVLPDGSKGHILVFSTVDEGERLSRSIPVGENSLRLLGAIILNAQKYLLLCGVSMDSRRISVLRAEELHGGEKPDLVDGMDFDDAVDSLVGQFFHPLDRRYMRDMLSFEMICQRLRIEPTFRVHCRVLLDEEHYYYLQFTRNGEADSFEDFVVALACEDNDVTARRTYENQIRAIIENTSHSPGWFHLDITANRVLNKGGTSKHVERINNELGVDRLMRSMATSIPTEKDRQEFIEAFNLEAIKQAYDAGEVEIRGESPCLYDDNVVRWSLYTMRLLMNPANNHLEAVFFMADETQEKEAYRTQISIVQTLSDNYLDVFLLNTRERTAIMVKHNGTESIQLAKNPKPLPYDGVIEKFVSMFVYPDDQDMMREVLKLDNVMEALKENREYSHNYRGIYHGELHYFQSRFIKNEEFGVVVMGTVNVDDVVAAEIEYQKELQKALDIANQASAEKSRFLARMSHDLRTPLNGIAGLLELSDKHNEDISYLRENRKKAIVVTNHMISLVNDVLDMAKIEDGSIVLAHEPFNIIDKCNDTMSMLVPQAQENGITISMNFTPQEERLTNLYGSPLHLCRAMMNILGNCIKYNRENGKINVDVQIIAYDQETATYRWTITDTGIGMSQDFLERIFEPFAQASTDTKSVYHGTGLGMSISKALIEQMGGTLEVFSELNVGSTFVVTIPFELADSSEIVRTDEVQVSSIEGMRLLLVEDNNLNREIAETILMDEGAVVTSVVNGREAVDAVAGNPPGTFDLVLMDVMMPVMDGYEATKMIRQMNRPDAQTLPILAMTANAFTEDMQKSLVAGMNAHITKPLDIPNMLRTIAQYRKNST